jgi:hypothetical protein
VLWSQWVREGLGLGAGEENAWNGLMQAGGVAQWLVQAC